LQLQYNFEFLFLKIALYFCDMRFFSFIMAFLVLWLSCLPCADEAFAMDTGKVKVEIVKKNSQQQEQNHKDACSPFCQCACCTGFSMNYTLAFASSLPIICKKQFACHLPATTVKISLPIWQPPQLGS